MKLHKVLSAALLTLSATIFTLPTHAADDAIKTMANILSHVNHFPSAAEKQTLNEIANNASNSAHIRAIASAMSNMQHSVGSADKAKLKEVVADASADQHTKDLANILMNFTHMPSGDDIKTLNEMMK